MTQQSDPPITNLPEPEQNDASSSDPASAERAGDLASIRELVLKAHPDVVPELVTGETVDDLLASVEPAEAAYRRISESLRSPSSMSTPPVPAGGERPMPVDPSRLPASEKIRRGLARR